jgi:hypothetical protein
MSSERGVTKNKTCIPCRISKIRCDVSGGSETCNRCARIGLKCEFVVSRRGQPSKNRDVARLGPAVRALLRGTSPEEPSSTAITATHLFDNCGITWHGNECQKHAVENINTDRGRLALLKHWLQIGIRSENCGLLGNILIIAHT